MHIYFGASGFFVLLALTIITCRIWSVAALSRTMDLIGPYLVVPYVFLYPVGFVLTWFVEQSMKVHFKHRVLVWLPMGFAGLLYLYLAINFFFRSIVW